MDLAAAGRMCLRRAIKANRWSRVGRVNKFQFRSLVLRGSARPMTTSPDDFSIFFIFLPIPKNRGEKQTKSKNRILTMALCKTLFSNSLEKEKRYNIFPFLFPEIRYSDDSYLRFFSGHSWMEIELKIWMYLPLHDLPEEITGYSIASTLQNDFFRWQSEPMAR